MREATAAQFMRRYQVDAAQAARVSELAIRIYDQIVGKNAGEDDPDRKLLDWAARLAEVGLSIAHAQYHKHSAYVLSNADMPGFSRVEQQRLARIVLAHRGKLEKVRTDGHRERRLEPRVRAAPRLDAAASPHPRAAAGAARDCRRRALFARAAEVLARAECAHGGRARVGSAAMGSRRPAVRRAAHVVGSRMELILWRHAEAAPGDPDAARALTDHGRRAGRGDGALARAAPVPGPSHDRLTRAARAGNRTRARAFVRDGRGARPRMRRRHPPEDRGLAARRAPRPHRRSPADARRGGRAIDRRATGRLAVQRLRRVLDAQRAGARAGAKRRSCSRSSPRSSSGMSEDLASAWLRCGRGFPELRFHARGVPGPMRSSSLRPPTPPRAQDRRTRRTRWAAPA